MHFLNGKKDAQPDDPEAPKLSRLHHEYPGQERLFDHSEPVSPRPLSMTSFDGVLPRPSSGVSAAFGWPAEPANPAKPSRLSILSTNWSDWSSSRKPSSPLSHNNNNNSNNNNASTTSFQSSLSRPYQPRLNPAAPTFESSLIKPTFRSGRDSMSIHDDASQTDASSFATADSANGSVLEVVPTKESLFSRLSLSRKGSTSKFNISWKKEGGLFSRARQRDQPSTSELGGEDSGEQTPENTLFPPIMTSDKDKTWRKDGFFLRRKGPASDTGDEAERERDKETPVTAIEPTPASSPWLKKDGFFSRKPKEEREGEKEEKGGKRASMEVGSPAGGRREGFFGKRDKEKGKERDREREGEKKEIAEVNEEGEGEVGA